MITLGSQCLGFSGFASDVSRVLWAGYRAMKVRTLHLQQKAESLAFCGQGGRRTAPKASAHSAADPPAGRELSGWKLQASILQLGPGLGSEDRGQGLPTDTLCICFGVSF